MSASEPTPRDIYDVTFAFYRSRVLHVAVKLDLFSFLAERGEASLEEIERELGLHERGARDFLDTLVALDFLERRDGEYSNTASTEKFLDRRKESYIGDSMLLAHDFLYEQWGGLYDSLKTGECQRDVEEDDAFDSMYEDEEFREIFLGAMSAPSETPGAIAESFDWERVDSVCDVGTANGAVPAALAEQYEHLRVVGFDLPAVESHFREAMRDRGLDERVEFVAGDFFEEPIPRVDVAILGHILHDWNLERRLEILRNVYDSLNDGGTIMIYGSIIDEDRREKASSLLMSLNMLVSTPGGSDYTPSEAFEWLEEAGFRDPRVEPLTSSKSMILGTK